MAADKPCILTINGGLSSIKFALYQTGEPPERRLHGNMDRIGLSGTTLTAEESIHTSPHSHSLATTNHKSAAKFLIDWLEKQPDFEAVHSVRCRTDYARSKPLDKKIRGEIASRLSYGYSLLLRHRKRAMAGC